MQVNWSKIALFSAGVFFGGTIDHVVLALLRSPRTPYGLTYGVAGDWLLSLMDAVIASLLYRLHRHLEPQRRDVGGTGQNQTPGALT